MKDLLIEEDQELLDMLSGASDGMAETLNDVLSMQKIGEGEMELIFAPFSIISASVTKVFAAISAAAAAKNLKLEEHIAADVPPLLLGGYHVEHDIVNLLSNAVEFSLIGGVIRLNVTSQSAATRRSRRASKCPFPTQVPANLWRTRAISSVTSSMSVPTTYTYSRGTDRGWGWL